MKDEKAEKLIKIFVALQIVFAIAGTATTIAIIYAACHFAFKWW